MIRFLWLGIQLFALIVVAVWLSDHPGKVTIAWQRYLIETSVGALIVLVVALMGLFVLANRLLSDLLRLPQRWSRHRDAVTSRRGRKALTGGLVAVASGDPAAAQRLARQSEATLVDPVLSHLLTAEALILSGENDSAESQFEMLLGREDTRVIGHRGLIEVAMARGDWARAYSRARQARAVMPKSPWLALLLIDLAARVGDLAEARATLDNAIKNRILPPAETRWRQTALLTAFAKQELGEGDSKKALATAEKVLETEPGFVPAATLAAELHHRNDRLKSAERVVERAWSLMPHPQLIATWHRIAPAADMASVARWMKRLVDAKPDNPDAKLAYAASAIDARLWEDARQILQSAVTEGSSNVSSRAFRLLGRLEQEEKGNLSAAIAWYQKADSDPAGATGWTCHACRHEMAEWHEICPACGAFGEVQAPDQARREPPRSQHPISLPGIGMPVTPNLAGQGL